MTLGSPLATRLRISFTCRVGNVMGFELVVAERSGKRMLIIRDGQHEYEFNEAA